jgi:hypothetical protein
MQEFGLSQTEGESFASFFESEITGTIEFKSDGTYEVISEGETDTGTWEVDGDVLTLDKGTADEANADIITLTSNQLVFQIDQTDDSTDINEDGVNDTMVMRITLNCSK